MKPTEELPELIAHLSDLGDALQDVATDPNLPIWLYTQIGHTSTRINELSTELLLHTLHARLYLDLQDICPDNGYAAPQDGDRGWGEMP